MKNGLRKYGDGRADRWTSTALSIAVLLLCALMLGVGTLRELRLQADLSQGRLALLRPDLQQDKHANLAWYIRSGQWRADIRSLAAAIQYLSEPVTVAQTNGPATKADSV